MRGGKKMPQLDSTTFSFYLLKWLQHGSKDDIHIFAKADLSTHEDLH